MFSCVQSVGLLEWKNGDFLNKAKLTNENAPNKVINVMLQIIYNGNI
jgi:hypothetical protein